MNRVNVCDICADRMPQNVRNKMYTFFCIHFFFSFKNAYYEMCYEIGTWDIEIFRLCCWLYYYYGHFRFVAVAPRVFCLSSESISLPLHMHNIFFAYRFRENFDLLQQCSLHAFYTAIDANSSCQLICAPNHMMSSRALFVHYARYFIQIFDI